MIKVAVIGAGSVLFTRLLARDILTIPELQETARMTVVSSTSIREGGAHDILLRETDVSVEP